MPDRDRESLALAILLVLEDKLEMPRNLPIATDPLAACIAEAVEAKGWRPPARVIATAGDLEALPVGVLVLHTPCTDGEPCLWYKIGDHLTRAPWTDLLSHCNDGEQLIVLWRPEVDGNA